MKGKFILAAAMALALPVLFSSCSDSYSHSSTGGTKYLISAVNSTNFTYDSQNRVTTVWWSNSSSYTLDYDSFTISGGTASNGYEGSFSLNDLGYISQIDLVTTPTSGSGTIYTYSYSYTYDAVGELTKISGTTELQSIGSTSVDSRSETVTLTWSGGNVTEVSNKISYSSWADTYVNDYYYSAGDNVYRLPTGAFEAAIGEGFIPLTELLYCGCFGLGTSELSLYRDKTIIQSSVLGKDTQTESFDNSYEMNDNGTISKETVYAAEYRYSYITVEIP